MFDLEAAIARWKRQATKHVGLDKGMLLEFEDHLREETGALVAGGRSVEDAWRLAAARLGSIEQLSREWAKVAKLGTADRAAFGAMGAMAALAIVGLPAAIALSPEGLLRDPLLIAHVLTLSSGYMLGLLAAAVAVYGMLRRLLAARPAAGVESTTLQWVRWTVVAATALTALGIGIGFFWAAAEWGQAFGSDPPKEWGSIVVLLTLAAATWAAWRGTPSETGGAHAVAIAIVVGDLILTTWFGVALLYDRAPLVFSLVSIGGFAASLWLAAVSLRVEQTAIA